MPLRKKNPGGQKKKKTIDATTSNDTSIEATDIVSLPDNGSAFIAVMGATGTGKSSFINAASGASLSVGGGLKSCTSDIQLSQTFNLKSNGKPVTLIDTPGFDDTSKSDVDTLGVITTFLANSYREKKKLSGIIYMHRISDVRMSGVATRNFAMFRNLCGDDALKNVVFVTSMWDKVTPEVGNQREAELKSEDIFFQPALSNGAAMMRYSSTSTSDAQSILLSLVKKDRTTLLVQKEMVDENKAVAETSAGSELCRQLLDQSARHEKEMQELVVELNEAARARDKQTRTELNEARQRILDEIARLETERKKFAGHERAPEQALVALGENVPKARGIIAWARVKILSWL